MLKRSLAIFPVWLFAVANGVSCFAAPLNSPPVVKPSSQLKVGVPINKIEFLRPVSSQPIFVTADYIRMHQPELIVGLVTNIKSGQTSTNALAPLVGADILTRLLASNMSPLLNRINLAQNAHVGSLTTLPIDYNSVTQSSSAPLLTLPGSEYSPHNIDDNPLRQNQKEYVTVKFTSPLTDSINASLSNGQNGHIKINWLRSYTGQWQATPAPNGPLEPIIANQASSNAMLSASAGQDCAVELELNFPNTGNYSSSLTVTGNGSAPWSFTVPIKVGVTQMGTSGATASVDENDLMMASNQTADLPITITPTNYHSPFTAKISAITLPGGVSMQSFSINISSRSNVHTKIHLIASSVQQQVYNYPVKFSLDPGDGSKTEFHSSITIEPYWAQWQFPANALIDGWGNPCEAWNYPVVELADTGTWYLSGTFWASAGYISYGSGKATFGFLFSTSSQTGVGEASWVDLSPVQFGALTGSSNNLHQNWNTYIHEIPSAWLSAGIQSNPPWTLNTSPQITISPL